MRIVAYDNARVTVLFPFEEVAPLSGALSHVITENVVSRYNFTRGPDLSVPRSELEKIGKKFENGYMSLGTSIINVVEFTIFGDGIVIRSIKTEDAELFWDDIITWMIDENGFRNFTSNPPRRFQSQIVVEFEKSLERLINSYKAISDVISTRLSAIYEAPIPMSLSRIDLGFDKLAEKSSLTVPNFIIERRVGIPFSRERYHCSAPMRTRDHVDILEQIERDLI